LEKANFDKSAGNKTQGIRVEEQSRHPFEVTAFRELEFTHLQMACLADRLAGARRGSENRGS
jgi:hypothetical protein